MRLYHTAYKYYDKCGYCGLLTIYYRGRGSSTGRAKRAKGTTITSPLRLRHVTAARDPMNPYNQALPDCREGYTAITKKTSIKAMLCPMIRDEEGFLSEFVAYHQMHGFDHIMFFDHGSTDNGLAELEPWVQTGFVSIKSNWTVEEINMGTTKKLRTQFLQVLNAKKLLEISCRAKAAEWGYDVFVSVDLDEYIIPYQEGITAVDALYNYAQSTRRYGVDKIPKLNFQSTPHLLEPVHMLTIEAYQTRMEQPNVMTFFKTVQNKAVVWLNGPHFTNTTREWAIQCCDFHGCGSGGGNISHSEWCSEYQDEAMAAMFKDATRWLPSVYLNHYSRSLEKFGLKVKSWKTSDGADKGYDMTHFLDRNLGWTTDTTATRYSCQLRELLANITGQPVYFRPGDFWYRNLEFGRAMNDPAKGKRSGQPVEAGYKVKWRNPYHYHGQYT